MDIYLRRHESAHMTDDSVSVQAIDIPYAHFDNQPLNGRLYLPDQSIPKGFVVQIHGGGWCSGYRFQDAKFVNTYKQMGGACKLMSFAGELHAFIKRNPDSLNSWAALKDIVDFIKSR